MDRQKMPKFEYRVVWKRRGEKRRATTVAKRSTADALAEKQRGLEVLFIDTADELEVAPLEYCVIEERRVGPWEAMVL